MVAGTSKGEGWRGGMVVENGKRRGGWKIEGKGVTFSIDYPKVFHRLPKNFPSTALLSHTKNTPKIFSGKTFST